MPKSGCTSNIINHKYLTYQKIIINHKYNNCTQQISKQVTIGSAASRLEFPKASNPPFLDSICFRSNMVLKMVFTNNKLSIKAFLMLVTKSPFHEAKFGIW